MPTVPNATLYRSYADLAAAQAEGEDYRVVVIPRATSRVAIVAPHGGSIILNPETGPKAFQTAHR